MDRVRWLCLAFTQASEDLLAFTIRHTSGVICASLEETRLEVGGVDSWLDAVIHDAPYRVATLNGTPSFLSRDGFVA